MSAAARDARLAMLERHVARLDRRLALYERLDRRFFWLRLGTLSGGLLLAVLVYLLAPAWIYLALLLGVLAFAVVVFFHRRLDRTRLRFSLARRLTAEQAARMRLDWAALPHTAASAEVAPAHPYAADLNLTGERSLHRLLDIAVSQGGSQRLLDWLLEPTPAPATIAARQGLVRELCPRTGFRRQLALNSAVVSGRPDDRWDGEALLAWLQRRRSGGSVLPLLLVLAGLAGLNIVLFLVWLAGALPAVWLISLALYGGLYFYNYSRLGGLFEDAQYLVVTLNRFRAVLAYLGRYKYDRDSALAHLCAPFWQADRRPALLLRQAARLASAASLQHNEFLWLAVNLFVPWDFYFSFRLDVFKDRLAQLLPGWLDVWYELEALNSLANFAYLNPGYTFAQVKPAAEGPGPVLQARQIGHPLLPHERKVCNDFEMPTLGQVVLVTGSNMSGKSTFLRTLGINLVLAYSGAPVNAERLATWPFRLFTCIQVSDSLNDGISYFYAEVRRLKALLDDLQRPHPFPQFFLIDEIFRGTNNREREIGSRAYVRALVGANGTGVISTHDLELINLADELPGVRNYHFREDVEGDRMVFDYRLRPGPSPTTNALKIMQIEGLPVQSGLQMGDKD